MYLNKPRLQAVQCCSSSVVPKRGIWWPAATDHDKQCFKEFVLRNFFDYYFGHTFLSWNCNNYNNNNNWHHLYARYLQPHTWNKPRFHSTQCCSCSVFTVCATCNVILLLLLFLLLPWALLCNWTLIYRSGKAQRKAFLLCGYSVLCIRNHQW